MKKIVFITTRNIINTSGELRLIKNRGKSLFEEYGIETYYYSLSPEKRKNLPKESLGDGSKLSIFYFRGMIHLNIQANKLFLQAMRDLNKDDIIIMSGFMPISIVKKIQKLKNKTYIDIHGTLAELKEYMPRSFGTKIKNLLIYKLCSYSETKVVKKVDGILVVSNALKEYYSYKFNLSREKIFVIPCGGNIKNIDIDRYYKDREFWRKKFDIKDELLFIYSGGISAWQSIDDMIMFYLEIKKNICKPSKLLIMSGKIEDIIKYENSKFDIMVRSFNAEKVSEVLCAGDVAMLLRNNTRTNNVAFPNKFYEYLQSGMYIICSEFIYDQSALVKEYKVGTISNGIVNKQLISDLENIGELPVRILNIELLLNQLDFKNTLKTFIDEIG